MTYAGSPNGEIGWGIIGTGWMAENHMVDAINRAPSSRVVAVHSSSKSRADRFARRAGIPAAYDDLESLLSDPAVDAVLVVGSPGTELEFAL